VTLPDPELDEGALADEELWPDDELVLDEELVPDEELVLDESPDVACDDPVLDLVDVPAELAVACVELGRVKASPPASGSGP
jgi:hypothetical protein